MLPNAHAFDTYLTGLGALLTIIYMAGLLFRPAKQHARLGIDSIAVLVVYVVGVVGLVALPTDVPANAACARWTTIPPGAVEPDGQAAAWKSTAEESGATIGSGKCGSVGFRLWVGIPIRRRGAPGPATAAAFLRTMFATTAGS